MGLRLLLLWFLSTRSAALQVQTLQPFVLFGLEAVEAPHLERCAGQHEKRK